MRILAALIGMAIGLAGLGIDFYVVMPPVMTVSETNPVARPLLDALVYFWSYFTHLTNLVLVLIYLSELTRWRILAILRRPVARASMAANIALVMAFFHVMLAPNYQFTGALAVGNVLLHYVAPSFYLLWWLFLTPHGALRLKDLPKMLLPGIAYLVLVLIRGAIVTEYPYAILDAHTYGYGQVAIGVSIVIACVALFSVILVLVDKPLGRFAPQPTGIAE